MAMQTPPTQADDKNQEPAPDSAQNPDDTQPHEGEHSPDQAQVGTSDGDDNSG